MPGSFTSALWDFGDGSTSSSTLDSLSHVYTNMGVYTVSLTVSNSFGLLDTAAITNAVTVGAAAFSLAPTNGVAPMTVYFNNSTMPGTFTSALWDFGDGSTSNSTLTSLSHVYTNMGVYTVSLAVSDGTELNTATLTNAVTVRAAAFLLAPSHGVAPMAVYFTNSTMPGTFTSAFWDFGDGSSSNSTLTSLSHVYTNIGIYTVSLTVSNSFGLLDKAAITNAVTVGAASISLAPTNGPAALMVYFTNSTPPGTFTSALWDFGDGSTSNSTLPTLNHTYTNAGVYTVSLTESDSSGTYSTATVTNAVTVTNSVSGSVAGHPRISYFTVQGGTNAILAGTNVASGTHQYYILTMTNVTSARSNWLPVLTNTCLADGSFSNNVPVNGARTYFLIQVPTP